MAEQTSIGANDGIISTQQVAASTGPFAVDFPFVSLDDVIVVITPDGATSQTLVRGVDYTLSATINGDGIYPSGMITLAVPVSNTLVTRWRSTALERTSQIPKTGFLDRNALNADLNRMMMAMQDFERHEGLYLRLPDEEGGFEVILPPAYERAGGALMADANGVLFFGTIVATGVSMSTFMTTQFLPCASAAAACAVLGAGQTGGDNAWSGVNSFGALSATTGSFAAASITTAVSPSENSTKIGPTSWVNARIAAEIGALGGTQTVPTIAVLTGSGTWSVPAGCTWFTVKAGAGGGAGGGNGAGNDGVDTVFDGINLDGGKGGHAFNELDGVGTPGRGGAGGTGGTGSGSATTIIRKGGSHGAIGTFASTTVPSAFGGDGAPSALGGSPGRGGSAGIGTAAAGGSGAGGGGYGSNDTNGGAGGGGSGETAELLYATPGASYTYGVGSGGAGSANSAAGGSGTIEITVHYNY